MGPFACRRCALFSTTIIGDTLPEDLVLGAVASAVTGVPEQVIWQWAARGKIARFPGRNRRDKTMYSLRQVEAKATTYRATPQRRPGRLKAAA